MGYPLPCPGCNMIAQDENIAAECFEEQGWVKDGKMVIHFPDCPFGPKVQYDWASDKVTHVPDELRETSPGLFVHKSVHKPKKSKKTPLGKAIRDFFGF